jgi:antagonist of KipI
MRIQVTKAGLLSTIQDLGRSTYLSQAVPVSGAMDTLSARLTNLVIGNNEDAAVIEFTYGGAAFTAETELLIAYTGDGAYLKVDGKTLGAGKPLFIPAKTEINLVNNPFGSRVYLAVAGGWDVPEVLGSKSTCLTAGFGGFMGRALQQQDILDSTNRLTALSEKILAGLKGPVLNYPAWQAATASLLSPNRKVIRVIPAHEFNWFNGRSIVDFLTEPYQLSPRSNRMGYQLEGPVVDRINKAELLSTAVTPGTIQVTGNGSLILLMADCQTTGGYPRIAQVALVDLPLCGQLKPGDELYFKEITWNEAEMLYIEQEKQLNKIAATIANKYL